MIGPCSGCAFWKLMAPAGPPPPPPPPPPGEVPAEPVGVCRFNPPSVGGQPITTASTECGRFEAAQ